ncbi:CopG family transcriptional regulator [Candidatus Sumerlaeota bacterium]|nr:CopG family transcriptional regulator [Candidatus Sumerlaeota bacterium]
MAWRQNHKEITLGVHDDLVEEVDAVVKKLKTTRSEFTRKALQQAIITIKERELERKHREGYRKHPVTKDEFRIWEKEQKWGDE